MPIRGLRARGGWWRGDKPISRLFPRHCVLWPDVQMCWQSQDDVILELGWGYWQHQLLLLLDCTDSQENQVLIKQREEELLSCGMLSEMALSISPSASVILGHTVIHFSICFFLFIPVRCMSDQSHPAVENIWQNSAIVFVSSQFFVFWVFFSFFSICTISFYFPYIKHSSS